MAPTTDASPPLAISADDTQHPVSSRRAWWGLAVLLLAYTLSFIDRTILSLLVEPLQRDLGLSDTQISLLQGLAFSLFYTFAGIPIAMVTDRTSRRGVIAIGIALWSAMTALCGLAGTYWQLFLARVGVGVGEAALGPAAFSLIADLFPPEKRGRAMAIYGSGTNIGAGLALIIGGAVIAFAAKAGPIDLGFGALRNWQLVFLLVGLPGLAIALLAMTIPEPRRKRAVGVKFVVEPVMPFVREHRATIACVFIGLSMCGLIAIAIASWAPTFFVRVYGYTPAETGFSLGLIMLIAGPIGSIAGGTMADLLTHRGHANATIRTALTGLVAMTASGVAAPLMPTPISALTIFGIAIFFGAFSYPAGAAAVQRLTPPNLRARLAAMYLFSVTLISATIGPTAVALTTDRWFGDPQMLGYSLAIVSGVGGVIGMAALTLGLSRFTGSIRQQEHAHG